MWDIIFYDIFVPLTAFKFVGVRSKILGSSSEVFGFGRCSEKFVRPLEKKKIGASSEIFLMKLHIITKFGMRFIFGLNKKESEKCDIESHRDKKKKIIVI